MTMPFKNIKIADSFFKRLLGLMFRRKMSEDEAIIFSKTPSIHTFFMRFPIDIVFADKDMRIIKICENIKPWRIVFCFGSYYAIECKGGQSWKNNIEVGDTFQMIMSKDL